MENQNLGEATTEVVEPSSSFFQTNKRNILIGIGIFVGVLLTGGVSYFLGTRTEKARLAAIVPTPVVVIPTAVPVLLTATPEATEPADIAPTIDPLTETWVTYTDAFYSFRHPKNWTVTAKDDGDLGHQITVANLSQTVILRVMSGKQTYSLGSEADISSVEIAVFVNGKTYTTREQTVNDRDIFVDFRLASTSNQEYQVLFGSGYPAGDGTKFSKTDYTANKDTVMRMLASMTMIK